ncbi:hypothetical protein FA15DRAFT_667001 [Coprinopsis marcescibilis]|uniref:F-box domain-containing protein n=1 Tax=Coprinopsis marcescibilis TaxID=230819 RepID=A0A5C3L2S8_COPMA|nr:hypothetical protein FA15DRAFT_667001 [Coprinopsis marcescibilis]
MDDFLRPTVPSIDQDLTPYLFNNDHVPDVLERLALQRLREADDTMRAIDGETGGLPGTSPEVTELGRQVIKVKNGYHRILAPVRKLPFELIAEILKASFRTGDMDGPERLALMKLRAICRMWRQVILMTPWFWRALVLDFGPNFDRPLPTSATTISDWFQRAGKDAPLKLIVDHSTSAMSMRTLLFHDLALLVAENRRWITLKLPLKPFDSRYIQTLQKVVSNPSLPWQYLTTLRIPIFLGGLAQRWPFDDPKAPSFETCLPRLQTLELDLRVASIFQTIPTPQLFHPTTTKLVLSLTCDLGGFLAEVLKQLPELTSLDLIINPDKLTKPLLVPHGLEIHLKRLRHLRLWGTQATFDAAHVLRLPALQLLSISSPTPPKKDFWQELSSVWNVMLLAHLSQSLQAIDISALLLERNSLTDLLWSTLSDMKIIRIDSFTSTLTSRLYDQHPILQVGLPSNITTVYTKRLTQADIDSFKKIKHLRARSGPMTVIYESVSDEARDFLAGTGGNSSGLVMRPGRWDFEEVVFC